jgi:KTSC domain
VTPEMEPVVSSNVASIGYDADNEDVYVEFIDGGTYIYSNVPAPVFDDFQRADSYGGFVNAVLKPGYPYRKL